jgi:thioredoxin 2
MSHTYSICDKCKAMNKVESQKALAGKAICGKCGAQLKLHGLVSQANTEDLRRIIKHSELPVIVDFWAEWCGPCKMYGPEFEKASREVSNVVFLKVNTETEQALSAELGIRGIPCTIIFKNGKEFKRQSGAMNSSGVKNLISN